MCAASAATGFRTWMQTHHFGWLTPRRMRALTLAVMSAAAVFSTIGFSGATPPSTAGAHVTTPPAAGAHASPARR
jgi:hypothetical protein